MSEEEALTEEQRIAILEGTVSKNRTLITIVAITMIIVLSVSVTLLVLRLLQSSEPTVTLSSFEAQNEIVLELQDQVKQQKSLIDNLNFTYEKSQAATFQKVMIGQEQSYQQFLATLKVGMYDLAKMIQGSRTWLDIYSERIEAAQNMSSAREKELNKVDTEAK